MASLTEETLDNFRGGLAERRASTEFGRGQWSKLHGFVIEDGGRLRSQWALQKIGGQQDIGALGVYEGHSGAVFLVAVTSSGAIRWAEAPADDETDDLDPTWQDLVNADASEPSSAGSPEQRRPVARVPLDQVTSAGFRSTLLLTSIHMGDDGTAVFVYEDDAGGTLRFFEVDELWPSSSLDEVAPKGQYGALWNGVLVLGDIEWRDDAEQELSQSNKKRWRNSLWLSEPGRPLDFDPLSVVHVGDAHERITGLQPIEAGLLVFTSSDSSSGGGVWILRGTPDAFSRAPLRLGVGANRGQAAWQETGTGAWVTATGEVWQTDGQQVARLDWQGLDVSRSPDAGNGVAEFGPWLLAALDDRLFACRALDDQEGAAWTELQVDGVGEIDMASVAHIGNQLLLLADGEVFRFTRADGPARGETPDGLVELKVGSRTLESRPPTQKTFWHRIGLRATAGSGAAVASVDRIRLSAGPVLDVDAPSLDREGPWSLLEGQAPRRWQALVRGPGACNELGVEVTMSGDVVVEQLAVAFRGAIRGDEEGR